MSALDWLLIVLLMVAVGFTLAFLIQMYNARKEADQAIASERAIREKLEPLERYRGIADLDAAADRIRQKANAEAASAQKEAAQVRADAATYIKEQREAADQLVNSATLESQRTIERARARAEEIAGEAWKAKENAAALKRAAIALRNIIKGYGDEYIIPSESVLDDLAEEYDHKEAGKELKRARSRTKAMVKAGQAAVCDYAEPHRRETAIRFVIDAFNGKADSILSRVKHDNLGKLRQQLKDGVSQVNLHGSAFRNARITPEYLDARLEELRWAVSARELQRKDREEQRAIREAMREEERARREYEKAIREAAKEEALIAKAMQQAEAKLAAASEAQRAQYEQQLEQLRSKLADAESKEERALSMAQQTRRGHVYIISNLGSFGDDVFKIGLTRRLEPLDRVRELGDASVPFPFDVHAMIFAEDAPALETELHRRFHVNQVNRVNPRKEFFQVGIADLRDAIEELEIEVHWTMKAEAREYHESLALKAQGEAVEIDEGVEDEDLVVEIPSRDPLAAFDDLLGSNGED